MSESVEEHLTSDTAFPAGAVVYYNLVVNGTLANSVFQTARRVSVNESTYNGVDYSVTDIDGNLLAHIPRENVLCICPLITTGPSDANIQS